MEISKKTKFKFNLSSLLCGLYTLSENDKFFKKVSLKNDIFLNINSNDYFSPELVNWHNFTKLLNKLSLRRFSYNLLKPVLTANYIDLALNNNNEGRTKECYEEIILFRKYLRKFKYNYRSYFIEQSRNFNNLPSDKELNTSAIDVLFLFSGI